MPAKTRPVWLSLTTLARAALAVLAAALAWSGAVWLLQLDWQVGPSAQRVNIRWVPDTAADPGKRARAQDSLRLTAAEEAGPRTWSYRLADRSAENIGRILSNPSVEDTHWLDRTGLRVQLNQPGLPGWVRELLEAEWALPVALLLLLAGSVPVWFNRRQIVAGPSELGRVWRQARSAAQAATRRVAARTRAVVSCRRPPNHAQRFPDFSGGKWPPAW